MLNYKNFDEINEICSWMDDDESRIILKQRFLYSISHNIQYVYDMIKLTGFKMEMLAGMYEKEIKDMYGDIAMHEDLLTFLLKHKQKEVIVFGCGRDSKKIVNLLKFADTSISAFADNYKRGNFLDYPVIPVEDIPQGALIIISSQLYRDEMLLQLRKLGHSMDHIFYPDINALYCPYGTSYFDKDIFLPCDEQAFIDGGGFHGETSKRFANWAKSYRRILTFEPDNRNAAICKEKLKDIDSVTVYNAALWEEDKLLSFKRSGDDGASSKVSEGNMEESIHGIALDSVVKEQVSFIKLDIEGAELKALQGAKGIIQRDRPRMAICIYHKPKDIWEIPLFIKRLVPEYHMAVRHYMTYVYDTILYCWI